MTTHERRLKIARLHSLIKKNPSFTGWAISKLHKLKESEESEDEKIRKAILHHLTRMWGNRQRDICGVNVVDAIAWLERQGERNTANKVELKFEIGD